MSCLGVSNDGISLCTGSWDSLVSFFFSNIPSFVIQGLILTSDFLSCSSRFGPGKPTKTKRKIPRVDHSAMLFFEIFLVRWFESPPLYDNNQLPGNPYPLGSYDNTLLTAQTSARRMRYGR